MNAFLEKLSGKNSGWILGISWALLYFIVREFLENAHFPQGVQVLLEALAIAFPLAVLLLMLLGLLELVVPLSTDDWSYRHVWSYLPLLYFIGLAITWKRYQ